MPKKLVVGSLGDLETVFDQLASEVKSTPAGNIAATDVQAALNELDLDKIATSEKGQANGVASLDGNGKIVSTQLPAIAVTDVFSVASIAARDALVVGPGDGEIQEGDVVIVTDASADPAITSGAASYIYNGTSYSLLKAGDEVLSVNGQTGVVSLDTDDVTEATSLYFTDERAQDAAGALATNSTKVSLTYNDGAGTLTPDIVAGSLVDADVNAAAAISATKLGNGDVDNTELSFVNGVTSSIQTQLNDKLDDSQLIDDDSFATATPTNIPSAESVKAYVDANTGTGANTTLSNLTSPTAINQDLIPGTDSTFDLGAVLGNRWATISSDTSFVANASITEATNALGVVGQRVRSENLNANQAMTLESIGNSDADAVATGTAYILTGNKLAGTGNSGNIRLQTGTSFGGGRGIIELNALGVDVFSTKIINVATPTGPQDAATKGYVDTRVQTDTVTSIDNTGTAGAYTVLATDELILVDGATGNINITLPSASGIAGRQITFKKTTQDFAYGELQPAGAETIDGFTVDRVTTLGESITIVSDGTNWQIKHRKTDTNWISYTDPENGGGLNTGPGVADIVAFWMRSGSNIIVQLSARVTTASGSVSAVTFGVPTGVVVNDSEIATAPSSIMRPLASATSYNITGPHAGADSAVPSWDTGNNRMRFFEKGTGSILLGNDMTANDELTVTFTVPVTNWKA